MQNENIKPRKWGILILFASFSTLICCALPILLVSLGMGAVVASLASNVPFLITLSLHKTWVFVISAIILLLATWALYRLGRACPTNPDLALACITAQKWNTRFLWSSIAIWVIGFVAAYILPILYVN